MTLKDAGFCLRMKGMFFFSIPPNLPGLMTFRDQGRSRTKKQKQAHVSATVRHRSQHSWCPAAAETEFVDGSMDSFFLQYICFSKHLHNSMTGVVLRGKVGTGVAQADQTVQSRSFHCTERPLSRQSFTQYPGMLGAHKTTGTWEMFIRHFEGLSLLSSYIHILWTSLFSSFSFSVSSGTCYSFAGLWPDQQHLGFPGELLQQYGIFSEPILGFACTAWKINKPKRSGWNKARVHGKDREKK